MSFSITDAKGELSAMLHGTTLGQVENINGVFNRAARQLLLDIDPAETKRTAPLSTPVYYGVYDYELPEDLKGNKIIDLIPPSSYNIRDQFGQAYNQDFDVYKRNSTVNRFTIVNNSSRKYIRIDYKNQVQNVLINAANGITGNGTWAASGSATNLQANNLITFNGQPCLTADLAATDNIFINSTMGPIDLSSHYKNGTFFLDIYVQSGLSNIDQIDIQFGSSAGDYYSSTGITTQYNGLPFELGQNVIGVNWTSMSTTGTPDNTKINYIKLLIKTSGPVYGLGFGQFWNNLGYLFSVEYYSRYLFRTSAGVWQEKTTKDDDQINLDTDSYNLFLYQAAFLCVQQALGQDAGYDTNVFLDKYNQALGRYKRMYKSEITKPQITYYQKPKQGYNSLLGRGYYSY